MDELCKRQVRRNVLKRKQEEVRLSGPVRVSACEPSGRVGFLFHLAIISGLSLF